MNQGVQDQIFHMSRLKLGLTWALMILIILVLPVSSVYIYYHSGTFQLLNAASGFIWIVVVCVVFIKMAWTRHIPFEHIFDSYLTIFALAFFVRYIGAALVIRGANFDIETFVDVANRLLIHADIYESSYGWWYPPLTAFSLVPDILLANTIHMPFSFVVKLPMIVADSCTAVGLLFVYKRIGSMNDWRIHLLYAINPVSIWVSAYHGQFDIIAVMFIIIAVIWLDHKTRGIRSDLFSALAYSLAVASKVWPLIYAPFLINKADNIRGKILYALMIPLASVLVMIPYMAYNPAVDWGIIASYRPASGPWGYSGILLLLQNSGLWSSAAYVDIFRRFGPYITFALIAILWVRQRNSTITVASVLCSATAIFYATSPTVAGQYLCWIVPLGLLAGKTRWVAVYSILVMPILLIGDFGVNMYGVFYKIYGDISYADSLTAVVMIPAWIWCIWYAFRSFSRSRTDMVSQMCLIL